LASLSFVVLFVSQIGCVAAQPPDDSTIANIDFQQKLGAQLSPDLAFRDELGQTVRLGDYFEKKPVILTLGYYECPMLCTMVLNGMVESLEDLKWNIGTEFSVVTVSIDPRETPAQAASKKRTYLKRYGRSGAAEGWHFLVGDEPSIRQLCAELGFQYVYDPVSKQFAHPSGLVIATPQGKLAAYLLGVSFKPQDVFNGLQSASLNQTRSPVQKLILLCFHYNPLTGKHSDAIMILVRVLSATSIVGLGWMVWMSCRTKPASSQNAKATASVRDGKELAGL